MLAIHTKNHNTKSKNLKTPFNRGAKNHNIKFRKHNIKFSGSGLKLNKSSFVIPSIIFGLVGITIICGFILSRPKSSTSANAVTSTATASVTVPDACSMSSTSTEHTGTVNGGTYTTDFGGESTVTVTCNDRNGYSVYAVGYSNDVEGTNGLIGTSTGLVIPSGTSTSTNVSNWAMKLTPVAGTYAPTILSDANGSFASYHIVPSTATKVAAYTSDINVANSSQFKTSYAVSISPTQAADTYVGKVKYTVVHPNYSNADGTIDSYNIPVNFAGTGVESVTFTASGYPTRTVTASGNTVNLIKDATYTVTTTLSSGYEFVSYSLNNSDYGALGSTTTNPTTFTTNTSSNSAVLIISSCTVTTFSGYMQDMDASTVANACVGDSGTLTDRRDNKAYNVAKINDNIWMIQNLRITNSAGKSIGVISSTDSNFTGGDITMTSTTSFTSFSTATYYDSGDGTRGVWYNACAAGARTGNSCSSSIAYSGSSDICPANWRLPDIGELIGIIDYKNIFSPIAGGFYYYNYGLIDNNMGFWWSSSTQGSNLQYQYYLRYDGSGLGTDSILRTNGLSIRCIYN